MVKHDPSLNDEFHALRARVEALERARRGRAVLTAAVAAVCLGSGFAWAQLKTFVADTPAVASDVNANFTLLKAWLEAKVGPVTLPVTGAQAASLTSATLNGETRLEGTTGRAALVRSNTSASAQPIFEVQHSNGTQGIGLGWSSIVATGSAADVGLTLSPKGAGRVVINELDPATEHGWDVACGSAAASNGVVSGNPFCCRLNTRDGSTSCVLAAAGNGTSWTSNAITYFGAAGAGRYRLTCVGGAPGGNYPFCCRVNAQTGSVVCGQGSTYALGSSGTASPW